MISEQPPRLTLAELAERIQAALAQAFPAPCWVAAEISELSENRNGHCYLELVERDAPGQGLRARARAILWARDYRMLKPYFETATGRELSAGIRVMALCHVNFHPVFGLSLGIVDLDPSFTLGEMALQRQATIQRLVSEGVFDMNRELALPVLPKRVAVISSPTAAGYQDFVNQLEGNPHRYVVEHRLFAATMQGDQAARSVVDALGRIHLDPTGWDLVAIIRGGGAQADLACFDSYEVVNHIAQFPIPVVTGIGHERDLAIADMVAHTRMKTPTAAAEFILGLYQRAESMLNEGLSRLAGATQSVLQGHSIRAHQLQGQIAPAVLRRIGAERLSAQRLEMARDQACRKHLHGLGNRLMQLAAHLRSRTMAQLLERRRALAALRLPLRAGPARLAERCHVRIAHLAQTLHTLSPESILRRGYSITLRHGRAITQAQEAQPGDTLTTILRQGTVRSTVNDPGQHIGQGEDGR